MSESLPFNIHTHTYRCGHASGRDKEYVEAAIAQGIPVLGFSDHVMLPHHEQPGIRGSISLLKDYIGSIQDLKKRYEGQCEIYVGFEAEWYGDQYASYYKELLERKDFDYLILGQHCFDYFGHLYWYARLTPPESIRKYRDDLIAGMESGLFTYVAHPDIYVAWEGEFDEAAEEVAEDICSTASRLGIPLELNCGMLRQTDYVRQEGSLAYPCAYFWKIAAKHGVKAIIGIDAHRPQDFASTDLAWMKEFARRMGLDLLTECPIKKGK